MRSNRSPATDPSAVPPSVRTISGRAFKRSFFGYRRGEVDAAIAEGDAVLDAERERADAAGLRAHAAEERADAGEERATELDLASLDLASQLERLELVSGRLAERVVEREAELRRLRVELRRVEAAALAGPDVAPVSGGGSGARPDDVALWSSSNLYEGLVEVELGPLSDFAQLVGFEDAASEIDATDGISVTAFAKGRATLEMHLSEPVELLRELEERAPFEFKVRDTREGRVVLDLDGV